MRTKLFLPLMVVFVASLITACSEAGDTDPYASVTLRDATRGMVVSKEFKYKFVNPQIIALNRNLGLIREGNLLEFIAARSLEDKLEGMMDGYFELNVVKKFSPFVHFKVETVATETDTVFVAQTGAIAYPRITTEEEFGTDSFEEPDVDNIPYNNAGVLRGFVGKKFKVGVQITAEKEEGKVYYVLHGAKAKFRVADTTDGVGLVLKMLVENGYPFEGGVILTAVEDYGPRIRTKTAGIVEVQYVMYGDRLISG